MNNRLVVIAAVFVLALVAGTVWFLARSESEVVPASVPKAIPAPESRSGVQQAANKAAQSSLPTSTKPVSKPAAAATAPRGPAISGRVTDARGNPVSGAAIKAIPESKDIRVRTPVSAESGGDGAFTLGPLEEGEYSVQASSAGHASSERQFQMAGTDGVILALGDVSFVAGTVLDAATQAPLAEFEVTATAAPAVQDPAIDLIAILRNQPWTPMKNPRGEFRLDNAPSNCALIVAARAPGHAIAYVTLPAVQPGAMQEAGAIRLPVGAHIDGVVLDAVGGAVAGAGIHVGLPVDKDTAVTTTDSAGRFTLTSLNPEETLLTATHPDYLRDVATVSPRVGTATPVQIVLERAGTVEGAVRQGGQPVSGQPVWLYGTEIAASALTATTDEKGHYSIGNVPPGEITVIVARDPGQSKQSGAVEGGAVTVIDFDLPTAYATVEGVIREGGRPPQRALITGGVSGMPAPVMAEADSDGAYRCENVPPGSVTITAHVSGGKHQGERAQTATFEIGEGQTIRQDFEFPAGATLSGTVTGIPEGEHGVVLVFPASAGSVNSLADIQRLDKAAYADLAGDGRFQFTALDPGSYTVAAVAIASTGDPAAGIIPTMRMASQPVTVNSGAETTVELRIK